MKNIHLLPTDRPSRLVKAILSDNLLLADVPNTNKHYTKYNIYITSDEEIKEGDWYLDTTINVVFKNDKIFLNGVGYKKIILTTDQDLIKDGVQAIDDDFLEWFVKNPSCEDIFVTDDYEQVNQDNPILRGSTNVIHKYKIIILKEEPDYTALLQPVGTKQETLEELSNEYAIGKSSAEIFRNAHKRDFIAGFKACEEQNKNMYSEEEVSELVDMLQKCKEYFLLKIDLKSEERADAIGQVLEKFKNK